MQYGENSLTVKEIIDTIDGSFDEDYSLDEILFQTGIDVIDEEYEKLPERWVE